jgi:hypothetical protein
VTDMQYSSKPCISDGGVVVLLCMVACCRAARQQILSHTLTVVARVPDYAAARTGRFHRPLHCSSAAGNENLLGARRSVSNKGLAGM